MTSKQDRKCMANKSIDRRVILRLNSWQSGALGKLSGSDDTHRDWIRDIQPAVPLIPLCTRPGLGLEAVCYCTSSFTLYTSLSLHGANVRMWCWTKNTEIGLAWTQMSLASQCEIKPRKNFCTILNWLLSCRFCWLFFPQVNHILQFCTTCGF